MALIKCPECCKEVSDKASVCVHCGYPLIVSQNEIDIYSLIEELKKQLEQLQTVFSANGDESHLYNEIKNTFTKINNATFSNEQYDDIIKLLVSYFLPCREFVGWKHIKRYFELVKYNQITSTGYDFCVNKLICEFAFSKIESSYMPETVFWYLIYQILENAPTSIQNNMKKHLQDKNAFGQTKIEALYSFAQQHINDDTSPSIVLPKTNMISNTSISKQNPPSCPYCQSTNVAKISTAGRVLSVGLFGLASKKVGKQWHCKKCGSDF